MKFPRKAIDLFIKYALAKFSIFFLFFAFTTLLAFTPRVYAGGTFPTSTVQLAWFYKPPTDGTTPANLVNSFKNVILTHNDEAYRDQLRAAGAVAPFLQYIRFDAIHDPGNGVCPNAIQPYGNQVAWTAGDYCAIQSQHPDWILRDTSGKAISVMEGGQRYVWMDPANTGWRDFWLSRVKQSQETLGWDGVFLDNVQASIDWYQRNNIQLMNYPDDGSLQAAVGGFLAQIYNTYFYPQNRPLQGNIIELPWASETPAWLNYLQDLDGAMQEDFAVGWQSGSFKTSTEWLDQLNRMEQSQQLGKQVILVSQGDQSDQQRQQFAFASYLLVAQGKASFRYANSNAYDKAWLYTNYSTALGAPSGPKYPVNSAWRRDFANGYVLADPVNHTGQIVLNTMTAPPPPPPTPIHVSKLTMWYASVPNSNNYQINTEVRVATDTGSYPPNANVTLTTVLPNLTQSVSIVAVDQYGYAEFSVQSPLKGTYTSTVTNLSGTGVSYNKAANVATTASKVIK
jgi:Hypothetical glycosyl hydrolase family 15